LIQFINNNELGRRRNTKKIPAMYNELYNKVKFIAGAKKISSFPQESLPEIAFVGRSNVGKSSLVNALTNSTVGKVSQKPGLTQQINFFLLQNSMHLVDLPGYGFALSSEEKKNNWQQLVRDYLTSRKTLKRTCLLLDARHGIKSSDILMIQLLEELFLI